MALLQTGTIALGSYVDDTWVLPGVGKGLSEHYGVWAILISDPILLISTGFAYQQFRLALRTLPCRGSEDADRIQSLAKPFLDFLALRGAAKYTYFLLVIVGALCWTLNVVQTMDPVGVYGNDVFDAVAYRWGFVANKLNLLISWAVVYPIVGYLLVAMSFSTWFILRRVERLEMLEPTVLHPDGCYGFENLGLLNVALLWPYVVTFGVMYALELTHEVSYLSLIIPMVILAIVCLVVGIVTIHPISAHARRIHKRTYSSLLTDKRGEKDDPPEQLRYVVERLTFSQASGSPYTKNVGNFLNALRFAPAAVTFVHLISGQAFGYEQEYLHNQSQPQASREEQQE
ncbi:hypothetical protein [uncultured Cohaesibacter sp.]|uniref:hypothetical protein n=1 Tax=uncultured Cohaesibacter sp. TaxID=1002546 RepID=UPI00374922BF